MKPSFVLLFLVLSVGRVAKSAPPYSLEGLLPRADTVFIGQLAKQQNGIINFRLVKSLRELKLIRRAKPQLLNFKLTGFSDGVQLEPNSRYFIISQGDPYFGYPKPIITLGQSIGGQAGYSGWIMFPLKTEGNQTFLEQIYSYQPLRRLTLQDAEKAVAQVPYNLTQRRISSNFHSFQRQKGSPNTNLYRRWHLLAKGRLMSVRVERALYQTPKSSHFFVRVRLTNLSQRPIGVELHKYERLIRPTGWGVGTQPFIGSIRVAVRRPEILWEFKKDKIRAAYTNKKLMMIPVGHSMDYYRDSDSSPKSESVEVRKGQYLKLFIDGQLFPTDGNEVEDVSCQSEATTIESVVFMRVPIRWKHIPSRAAIFLREQ